MTTEFTDIPVLDISGLLDESGPGYPDAVRALVISSSGFFSDGKWHGMALACLLYTSPSPRDRS